MREDRRWLLSPSRLNPRPPSAYAAFGQARVVSDVIGEHTRHHKQGQKEEEDEEGEEGEEGEEDEEDEEEKQTGRLPAILAMLMTNLISAIVATCTGVSEAAVSAVRPLINRHMWMFNGIDVLASPFSASPSTASLIQVPPTPPPHHKTENLSSERCPPPPEDPVGTTSRAERSPRPPDRSKRQRIS